ncbi:sulfotransferase domain-containing protein [Spirosoma linguale]|uniref:Sulfotransferase n=1 Tax=Spirosoma linguale (strain ATCC 33905 / DSM 74 / LMG 10896 / Claus 1) TaxID=504472 RepID=D2QF04_SPILD|nr:sulfotransferase [Spirosoma linguale DSM 74]
MLTQQLINKHLPTRIGQRWRRLKTQTWGRLTAGWRKMPDFLIIGAQKAGTTSLFHYLAQHPDLAMPIDKEIHYYDVNYQKGINWYKQYFPLRSSASCSGEATPYYLFHPFVAKRIAHDMPGVKLIVCLRDPALRAFSHYQMMKRFGIEWLTFEEAIEQEPVRYQQGLRALTIDPLKRSPFHQDFSYLSRGKYARQIRQWLTYFPREQFLFLSSEELARHPAQALTRVYTFLGIRALLPTDLSHQNKGDAGSINPELLTRLRAYYQRDRKATEQLTGLNWTD